MTFSKAVKVARALAMGVLLAAPAAWAQTQWTLSPGYPADVFHTQNLVQFAQDLTRASGGKLNVQVGELGKPYTMAEVRQAVGEGKVQGGNVLGSAMSKEFPLAGADSIPFMTASLADAQRLWKYQRPLLEEDLARKGLKLLYAVPWPSQGLYAVQPVRGIADLKDSRMRTYNPATVRIAELLGAKPIDLAAGPPMTKALAEGTIDSMITSSATGMDMKVWQRFKYFYDIRAWYPKNLTFVNSAAFNALDEATKKAVLEAASRAEAAGWEESERVAGNALAELRRNQMEVAPSPVDLRPYLRRFGERFAREWIESVGMQANSIFIPYYTSN